MLIRSIVGVVGSAAFIAGATAQDVVPRIPLPKTEVVAPVSVPVRLVVKFNDNVLARAVEGGLASEAGADVGEATAVAARHGASYSQLIQLSEATISFLEERATINSRVAQPDLAGMMRVEAPDESLPALAAELNALAIVEWVEFEEVNPPPPGGLGDGCADIAPPTPPYFSLQGYHQPNPGLNMQAAWLLGSARGAGIRVADCEYGYNPNHEDLCGVVMEQGQTIHPQVISNGWDEHGTAVLGEIGSQDNVYGCLGLVPEVDKYFFTEWSVEQGSRRATCIANAIAEMDAGDIVVLEMQTTGGGGGYGPAELNASVWTLVKNGTDAGILVVAAAGNGNQNLDSSPYDSYRARGDSGAVIVGAGTSTTAHDKLSFSTYGARVNLQAWGQNVFTLGYGSYAQHGGDKNQRYTAGFNGTSSATPLVSAAVIALQGLAVEYLGRNLTPLDMRELLIETGIPQGAGGHIGPFPNVLVAGEAIIDMGDSLTDIEIVTGTIISGDIASLRNSDNLRLRVRSGFGATVTDLHRMVMVVRARTSVPDPSTLDLAIESRINHSAGTAVVRLWDYDASHTAIVGQYAIGTTESVRSFENLDASRFVSDSGGVEITIRHVVVVPVFAFTFDSLVDWIGVTVE